jgi:hypothetical protein
MCADEEEHCIYRHKMIDRHIRKAKLSEEEARYYRAGKAAKETLYLRLRRTRIRVNVRAAPPRASTHTFKPWHISSRISHKQPTGLPSVVAAWPGRLRRGNDRPTHSRHYGWMPLTRFSPSAFVCVWWSL